jgi:hypothetical protein
MSDSEYDSEYSSDSDGSENGSDCSEETYATGETEVTFSSFQEALEEMMAGLAQLDEGLHFIDTKATSLEQPVSNVAIGSFTNPRILESAPFRETKFRLRHSVKIFLNTPHHTVTFAELGEAIRTAIRERKEEVVTMWGTADFLGILQRLPDIVE